MTKDYRPRLSINISEEQQRKLQKFFPWGTQRKIFGVILDDFLKLCENHGADYVLGAYLGRYLKLEQVSKLSFESKPNGDNS